MTDLLFATAADCNEQREYSEAVRLSAEALLATISDILDMTKIEAGNSRSKRRRSTCDGW